MTEFERSRKRLIKRCRRIIRDSEQLARDKQWWNNHRLDAPPFDLGAELATAAIAKQILEKVEAGERIPAELGRRLVDVSKQ